MSTQTMCNIYFPHKDLVGLTLTRYISHVSLTELYWIDCNEMYDIVTDCNVMYSIVTDCSIIYSIVTGCNIMYSVVTDCIVICSVVTGCNAMYSIVTGCNVMFSIVTDYSVMYSIVTDCNVMHSIVTDCNVLYSNVTDCNVMWLTSLYCSSCTVVLIHTPENMLKCWSYHSIPHARQRFLTKVKNPPTCDGSKHVALAQQRINARLKKNDYLKSHS